MGETLSYPMIAKQSLTYERPTCIQVLVPKKSSYRRERKKRPTSGYPTGWRLRYWLEDERHQYPNL